MEVDILGPLRLRIDGQPVEVPGERRGALLGLLAVARGTTVSVARIVDAVWGDDPPSAAANAVQSHVSRLRRHLGAAAGCLANEAGGYRLVLGEDGLDADRAERLAREGRVRLGEDPGAAGQLFATALQLWRGPALEEFPDVEPLAAEAVRLAELKSSLTEELLAARLETERPEEVVDAIAKAAAEHPWRESTQTLFMVGLARCGRGAEALRVGHAYRNRLAEHTGLEPSTALAVVETRIARGELGSAGAPATAAVSQLPRPPTPLLGRESDLRRVGEWVGAGSCVSVVGPGGVGKTRLALEAAHACAPAFADGAVFIELASLRQPGAVASLVAQRCSVRGPGDPLTALADYLSVRRQLLVIDNCEHVLDEVRTVGDELLRWCPGVALLLTSREPVGIASECVFRLEPLALPSAAEVLTGEAAESPPVALFTDRARRARGAFAPTADNLVAVVDICRRLDGLPLAIELAAGRLASIGLVELQRRIDNRLDLAPLGRRGDDERHRTLRTTISWSYELLEGHEQRYFRYLSVFPDQFDLEAAEHVGRGCGLRVDAMTVLSRLVDASMVTASEAADGTLHYYLLESIRTFGFEQLVAAGEAEEAMELLAAWVTGFVETAARKLMGPGEPTWAPRVAASLPTLRAARRFWLGRGDVEAAARLCVDLDLFWLWRDYPEPWSWALELAEDCRIPGTPIEALLVAAAGRAAWRLGYLERARELGERAMAGAGDGLSRAAALDVCSVVALLSGRPREALEQALKSVEQDSESDVSSMLGVAALAAAYEGRDEAARELVERAQAVADSLGAQTLLAFAAYVRGEVLARKGDPAAPGHLERAIQLSTRSGASFVTALATLTLASSAARTGELVQACSSYLEVIRYWERTGSWTQQWTTLRNVAELLTRCGRYSDAAVLLAAADSDPDASAVVGTERTRLLACRDLVIRKLGDAEAERLGGAATGMSRAEVVQRALDSVRALHEELHLRGVANGVPAPERRCR